MMKEYHIGGIPVVDEDRKLCRHCHQPATSFEQNPLRPIDEVMTKDDWL